MRSLGSGSQRCQRSSEGEEGGASLVQQLGRTPIAPWPQARRFSLVFAARIRGCTEGPSDLLAGAFSQAPRATGIQGIRLTICVVSCHESHHIHGLAGVQKLQTCAAEQGTALCVSSGYVSGTVLCSTDFYPARKHVQARHSHHYGGAAVDVTLLRRSDDKHAMDCWLPQEEAV